MKVKVRKFRALRMAGGSWDNTVSAIESQYVVPLDGTRIFSYPQALEELGIREDLNIFSELIEGLSKEDAILLVDKLNDLLAKFVKKVDIEIIEEAPAVLKTSEPLPEGAIRWESGKGYYVVLSKEGVKEEIKKLIDEARRVAEKESQSSNGLSAQEKLAKAILGETKEVSN